MQGREQRRGRKRGGSYGRDQYKDINDGVPAKPGPAVAHGRWAHAQSAALHSRGPCWCCCFLSKASGASPAPSPPTPCLSLPVCVAQLRAETKGRAAAVSNDDGLWMMISRIAS